MKREHKIKIAHYAAIAFVFVIVIFSMYSVFNYRVLKTQITSGVESRGYVYLFISSFFLESFPSLIGPGTPLLAGILVKLDLKIMLIVLLISTTISSLLTYYLGYKYSEEFRSLVSKKNIKTYDRLFKKYGKAAMIIAAITAVPYIPVLAGIFKMKPSYFIFVVTTIRILNYIFLSYVLYFAVNYNWLGLIG